MCRKLNTIKCYFLKISPEFTMQKTNNKFFQWILFSNTIGKYKPELSAYVKIYLQMYLKISTCYLSWSKLNIENVEKYWTWQAYRRYQVLNVGYRRYRYCRVPPHCQAFFNRTVDIHSRMGPIVEEFLHQPVSR